jgi:hypothetical protein
MAKTPEARVKDAVKKWLKDRGIWFYMPMQSGYGVVGIPDFICCWNGMFFAIETKAPGKRNNTTANQEMQLANIKQARGLAIVVDDVSQLDEFEKEL